MKLRKIPYIAALIFFISIFGCDDMPNTTGEDEQNRMKPLPVVKTAVPDTVSLGQEVEFEVTVRTPTPCWEFDHFEISRNGFEVLIKVFGQRTTAAPCPAVLDSFQHTGTLTPATSGTYFFQFWVDEKQTLNETVVVRR